MPVSLTAWSKTSSNCKYGGARPSQDARSEKLGLKAFKALIGGCNEGATAEYERCRFGPAQSRIIRIALWLAS